MLSSIKIKVIDENNRIISNTDNELEKSYISYFDWDDTCFPSSFLLKKNKNKNNTNKNENQMQIEIEIQTQNKIWIDKLQKSLILIWELLLQKGSVYIVTNSEAGWVEKCAKKYMPKLLPFFVKSIKIISARSTYQHDPIWGQLLANPATFLPSFSTSSSSCKSIYLDSRFVWKFFAFQNDLKIQNQIRPIFNQNKYQVHILGFGDSIYDYYALHEAVKSFDPEKTNSNNVFTKTIQFALIPDCSELYGEIKFVSQLLNFFLIQDRNLKLKLSSNDIKVLTNQTTKHDIKNNQVKTKQTQNTGIKNNQITINNQQESNEIKNNQITTTQLTTNILNQKESSNIDSNQKQIQDKSSSKLLSISSFSKLNYPLHALENLSHFSSLIYSENIYNNSSYSSSSSKLIKIKKPNRTIINFPLLFLDYDGTLTPIISNPDLAFLSFDMYQIITHLTKKWPGRVGIVSKRKLSKLEKFIDIQGLWYGASHGFDIKGPNNSNITTNNNNIYKYQVAKRFLPALQRLYSLICSRLVHIPTCLVEDNIYSITVDYRNLMNKKEQKEIETYLDEEIERVNKETGNQTYLIKKEGKYIYEVRPCVQWDKGEAIKLIIEQMSSQYLDQLSISVNNNNNHNKENVNLLNIIPIYIGDDICDEDAFLVLNEWPNSITIHVKSQDFTPRITCAKYVVDNTAQVQKVLESFLKM